MRLECRVWLDGEDCGTVPIVEANGQKVFGDACYWLIDRLQSPEDEEHERYARAEAGIVNAIARNAVAGAFICERGTIRWRLVEAAQPAAVNCML